MKRLAIPFICFMVICCGKHKTLTEREKLDSVKLGMTMQEVMLIYGLEDTLNRSSIAGQCGYEFDSLTGEEVVGKDGLSPLVSVEMSDSISLLFTNGKLMMKPQYTNGEMGEDTMFNRLLNSPHP